MASAGQNITPIKCFASLPLDTYERSEIKVYLDQTLVTNPESKFAPLSTYLNAYVDELLTQHNVKFLENGDFLKNFDILDPRLWKSGEQPDPNDHPIVNIASFFQINNHENLGYIWDMTKKMIMESSFFCPHSR